MENSQTHYTHTHWLTKCWKISFLATKSVSQLSSIIAALFSLCASASNPSAAVRADFFDASTFPLFLNSLCAASAKQYHIFTFKSTITLRKTQKIKIKITKEIKWGFWFGPMSQLLSIRAALTSFMGAQVRSLSCFIRFVWFEEEEPSELNLLETIARPPPPPHREWAYV